MKFTKGVARSASRSSRKSLILGTSDSSWNQPILSSRNAIDLIFGANFFSDNTFYNFSNFEKGGQKGGHLWISNLTHDSKLTKIIRFHINFEYYGIYRACPPFWLPPFFKVIWSVKIKGDVGVQDSWQISEVKREKLVVIIGRTSLKTRSNLMKTKAHQFEESCSDSKFIIILFIFTNVTKNL